MQEWTSQTPFTDPGVGARALIAIGGDPEPVVAAIQGLLIHGAAVEYYGLEAREFNRETLPVAARLGAVLSADNRPLSIPRSPETRALATCRDYAVFVCAAMRGHGRAARVRCGFASYLGGAPWEDHWICELRSEDRWQRIDAQLDPVLREVLGTGFPAVDVPSEEFMTADEAWRACRSGRFYSGDFGHGDARGLWFVYVNLMRDRLALADQLTSDWDSWRAVAPNPPWLTEDSLTVADGLASGKSVAAQHLRPWWAV